MSTLATYKYEPLQMLCPISCSRRGWSSGLQIPGNVDDDDAHVAPDEEKQLQQLSTLVVKRSLPPMFDDEFRDQNGDLAGRIVALQLQNVIDQRQYDEAIGCRQKNQSGTGLPRVMQRRYDILLPHPLHLIAALLGVDVDRLNVIADLQGEAEAFFGDAGPAVKGNDDEGLCEIIDAHRAIDSDLFANAGIVGFHCAQ